MLQPNEFPTENVIAIAVQLETNGIFLDKSTSSFMNASRCTQRFWEVPRETTFSEKVAAIIKCILKAIGEQWNVIKTYFSTNKKILLIIIFNSNNHYILKILLYICDTSVPLI